MTEILKIPKDDVIWVYKSMTNSAITKELERFHVDVSIEPKKQKPTARHIVGVSSCLAVGLTFAEALTVGFLEPDFRPANEIQGWFRHCRQGNENPEVYSWMFIADGSKVEERIQSVNKLRKAIQGTVSRKVGEVKKNEEA